MLSTTMDSSLAATVTANSSLASCILFLLTVALILVARHEHERKSLPPGPRGIPIVGNVFDVPQEQPWATFSNLSRRYGESNNPRHLRTPTHFLHRGRDMHIYPWPNNNRAELHVICFRSVGETIVYLLNPSQRFCLYLSGVCLDNLSFTLRHLRLLTTAS